MCRKHQTRQPLVVTPAPMTDFPPSYSQVYPQITGVVSRNPDDIPAYNPDVKTATFPENPYKDDMEKEKLLDHDADITDESDIERYPAPHPDHSNPMPQYGLTPTALLSSVVKFAAGRGWENPPNWQPNINTSNPPAPYGPTPGALLTSVAKFATGQGWEKPPNWVPPQTGYNVAVHGNNCSGRGCRSRCAQSARGCGGCSKNCNHSGNCGSNINPGVTRTDILQNDLQTFNVTIGDVIQRKCGAKCEAKQAIRNLTRHLYEIESNRHGGKLSCEERKSLKAEVKMVSSELNAAIKEAKRGRHC